MFACTIRILGRGRYASKTHPSLEPAGGGACLAGHGAALGLGKLTVNSSLGQPLSAQIELTSVAKEELDSLSARVADPSLYRQNNLAYQGVLSRARVTVERAAERRAVPAGSRRTRRSASRILDLLVEVNWASGRVVRDYTFLLDPPGCHDAGRAGRAGGAARVRAPRAARAARRGRSRSSAARRRSAKAAGGAGDTYTVKRGDTLSKIANEYQAAERDARPDAGRAVQRNNADAFDGKNMNRLRAGAILTIPSADEVAGDGGRPRRRRSSRVQASDWRAYRDRVAAAAPAAEGAGGARRRRQDRHDGRGDSAGRAARDATSSRSRAKRAGKGAGGAPKKRSRATRR